MRAAEASRASVTLWNALLLAAVVVATVVVATVSTLGISRPLGRLRACMAALADGDDSVEVSGLARQDEIGAMAKTVDVFRRNAIEARPGCAMSMSTRNTRRRRSGWPVLRRLADGFEARGGRGDPVGRLGHVAVAGGVEEHGGQRGADQFGK